MVKNKYVLKEYDEIIEDLKTQKKK